MIQLDALPPLDPLPPLPVLQAPSVVDPYQPTTTVVYHREEVTPVMVVGAVAVLGLLFGVGYLYNRWAYDDWTCMFKNCVQTSSKRR